ncbi:MAG TPA: RnfABCDGE type electron transport complex subunit B, partial [Tenuifilaceae bacterium]|nr:RnfABCDGE type electron transport complex subunit B [Tenuifilaceae bacterium]
MSSVLTTSILMLTILGVVLAVILYVVAQKFKVEEDPRIDEVEALLPGANCGGCGYPGCRGLADALVKADDISAISCPVGGNETMRKVAAILGKAVEDKDPQIAVVRCSGSPQNRTRVVEYNGISSCKFASTLYSGDTGCQFGCLGLGDCVAVCKFDAIYIDPVSLLPVIDEEKCTACGACVKAC